jgi:lipoprotein-releasing system permease protein
LKNDLDPSQFRRKLGSFKVSGILDLGKHEYNQRMILTSLPATQSLAEIGNRYSGLLLKFQDINRAREISTFLGRELGLGFSVRDWREANENLFEAVGLERIIVFFVIMIIVVAAAFNVASTLYINVITRYSQIGLLKSLGVSRRGILQIFSLQGVLIGALGIVGGLLLGALLCVGASWAESYYSILPGSIYKLDHIDLSIRPLDVMVIAVVTLIICFLATLAPAYRGSRLSPVEGIKNE